MRIPGLSTPPTAGALYSEAFDAAHEAAQQLNVRMNTMYVQGALALRLAQIGSMIVVGPRTRKGNVPNYMDPLSPVHDYIGVGAKVSFALLEQAITPAARVVGLGNFTLSACDADGQIMPQHGVLANETLPRAVGDFRYALGEDGSDFYVAAASGAAAIAVGRAKSLPRASGAARELVRTEGYDNAVSALEQVAEHSFEVVSHTLAAHPDAQTIPSLYVSVLPNQGAADAAQGNELFQTPVTIYLPANN